MARTEVCGRRLLLVALIVLALGGCARAPVVVTPPPPPPPSRTDLYIVLPGADGKTGQITVIQGGAQQVLNTPYAAVRAPSGSQLESITASEGQVRQIFSTTLEALPPAPTSIVLYFMLDSDQLTSESHEVAKKLLAEVAQRPSPEVVVIGHTDRVGSLDYNDRLSIQRAEKVRDELLRLGVEPGRIRVEGRGEREPLVPTDDETPEPRNRRVEVSVR
jgi:outer membrane protein OmpA-like peptidoglycan-associated protein